MTIDLTHVLVFKTNISSDTDKQKVAEILASNPLVKEWSVDTEDVDRVLRVVSPDLKAGQIINIINESGFVCAELE